MISDKDKAAEYDRIAGYLRNNGWSAVKEWQHPVDGTKHETWRHPDCGENSFYDIMSAYRVECYKDAPAQGKRLRCLLNDLGRKS